MPWLMNRVIYGVDGEHRTPYMRQIQIGRLRFHVFYRGDADPDYHDHPWWFMTFPLTHYVEDVYDPATGTVKMRPVRRFQWHYRPAEFAHRVIGRAREGRGTSWDLVPGNIYSIVWRGKGNRRWGFWRRRCRQWMFWRDYVYNGGKHAPCLDE